MQAFNQKINRVDARNTWICSEEKRNDSSNIKDAATKSSNAISKDIDKHDRYTEKVLNSGIQKIER